MSRRDLLDDERTRESIALVIVVALLAVAGIGIAMVWWLRFVDRLTDAVR